MIAVTFHLEAFDGPLDLLLHLISKNKINIYDIPIAEILEQYLEMINAMREFDLEVASEFVAMAAQLMYIKSKMLLPVYDDEGQEDPRAPLVEALLEYQRFKEASGMLNGMSELGKDLFVKPPEPKNRNKKAEYAYSADALVRAIHAILERAERKLPPPVTAFSGIVGREPVPVSDKIATLVRLFQVQKEVNFTDFVLQASSRSEIVATFLAVLELSKSKKIHIDNRNDEYILSIMGDTTNEPD